MILRFEQINRIEKDQDIRVSSEQIVDSEEEAHKAGYDFAHLFKAFLDGYGEGNQEAWGAS